MAPRKIEPVEPVELDADDYWAELSTENAVPPMKVKGIVLEQPTADVAEKWQDGGMTDEKLLFGEQYDAVMALFNDEPLFKKKNFYKAYMKHMFGIEGDSLKS